MEPMPKGHIKKNAKVHITTYMQVIKYLKGIRNMVTILSVQFSNIFCCIQGYYIFIFICSLQFFHNPSIYLTSASNFTSTLSLWRRSLLTSPPPPHITPPLLFLNLLSLPPPLSSVSLFHRTTLPLFPPTTLSPFLTLSRSIFLMSAVSCKVMWAECQVLPTEQANYV